MKDNSYLIEEKIENFFFPGKIIELVFEYGNNKIIKSTQILNCNYSENKIIVFKSSSQLPDNLNNISIIITTLVKIDTDEIIRVGVNCEKIEFIKEYKIADDKIVEAILIEFSLPMKQLDLRTAYRIQPNITYQVNAKLIWERDEYESNEDFSIYNISATGIGIIVHNNKEITDKRKHLTNLIPKAQINVILFLENSPNNSNLTILSGIEIVSIDSQETITFIRAKFCDVDIMDGETLYKFTDEAKENEVQS
ncbi:MAG: hypothetical protein HQK79_05405 [Desulfobacterales bacterium]|nr:hypothetical protein [Desulfobacterales bacterium]MBF0398412.1 hypothetical protein [Desulfobacterales bacterium]